MRVSPLSAVEVRGSTRAAFLVRAVLAVGGAYGAGAAGAFASRALAQTSSSDVDTLNFALTLENVEVALYRTALANVALPADLRALATELGYHEQQHASALSQAITQAGGTPAGAPAATFRLSDARGFVTLARSLEETGVAAYNGAIGTLSSPDLVAAAASIAQVEARHAAALNLRGGGRPAPSAFDRAIGTAQARTAIKPYTG